MRRAAALLLLAASLAGVTGCSHGGSGGGGDGQLTIAQVQEPRSLNPLYLDGVVGGEINGLVYSFLITYDTSGNLIPQVAAQVPTLKNGGISKDGMHVTYHLRHDVKWQDGAPLTARDVVFTFNAIMSPNNATLSRYGYDSIKDAKALDDYTVRIDLKKPLAAIVSYFFGGDSNYGILPAHLLAKYSSLNNVSFNSAPVGSGPYRVVHWARGDRVVFEANPNYFLGAPAIKKIVLKIVPDSQTIINQLRTGEVQAVFFADVSHLPELKSIPHHRIVETSTTQFGTLQLNTEAPITKDVVVRRALAMSIDRNALTTKIFKGVFDPNSAMQGLFTWSYDPSAGNIPYDPEQAGKLLDEDGWRMGADGVRHKDGKPLEMSFLAISGSVAATNVVTQIVAYASKIGMRLTPRTLTPFYITSPSGPLYQGKYQVSQFGEQSNVDPDVAWIIGCDQRAPGGFNFTRYCNPKTQALLDDASASFDRARRMRDYAAVQRQLIADVPIVFLYHVKELDVIPDNMQGYTPSMYTSPYTFAYKWKL